MYHRLSDLESVMSRYGRCVIHPVRVQPREYYNRWCGDMAVAVACAKHQGVKRWGGMVVVCEHLTPDRSRLRGLVTHLSTAPVLLVPAFTGRYVLAA